MTDQAKEVDLQKKIRRTKKSSIVDIIVGSIFLILGWPLYNLAIHHYFLGAIWTEYPYRPVGLALIIGGILLIGVGIVGLFYFRLQTKKYREQLRQGQQ